MVIAEESLATVLDLWQQLLGSTTAWVFWFCILQVNCFGLLGKATVRFGFEFVG
jgi:hypothetical protein